MTLFNVRQRKLITRLLRNKRGVVCAVWISFFGFEGFIRFRNGLDEPCGVKLCAMPLNRSSDQLADLLDDSPGCS